MKKNIGLKIESALVEQFAPDIFNNVDNHFFDHHIGQERDHLTSLLRLVVKRYLNLRLKTWQEIHRNDSSQKLAIKLGTIKKMSHLKASLHFRHALYNPGIVLIVFVSLRAFI